MTMGYYHGLCNKYRGRAVEIRTRDGRVHRGIIHRVSGNRVYLQPMRRGRNLEALVMVITEVGGSAQE